SAVRSALTRARERPSSVASTVPASTRSPSATRQAMRTSGSSARWQASNHGRPQTTASSLHSSQALSGPSGSRAAVTSPVPRSSSRARATSASTTSRGGGASLSIASGLREAVDLVGGDGFVGQQHGDAVVDAVDALAVAGDQGFTHGRRFRRAVGTGDAPGRDRRVEGFKPALFKYRQRQAGSRANKDVEQLAIHGNTLADGPESLSPAPAGMPASLPRREEAGVPRGESRLE